MNVAYGSKYPIELASHDGKLDIVKILIANGANVNTNTNRWGILFHPALTWASIMRHAEVVELLLNADADPLFVSYGNVSALQMATYNGFTEIFELLNNRIEFDKSNNYLAARRVTEKGRDAITAIGEDNRFEPGIVREIASYLGGKRKSIRKKK